MRCARLGSGLTIVDIGGGLAGMQYILAAKVIMWSTSIPAAAMARSGASIPEITSTCAAPLERRRRWWRKR